MPATYAHLTMVNLMTDRLHEMPEEIERPYRLYKRYCEMGAVSPDFPYLDLDNSDAEEWADLMHKKTAFDMIDVGVAYLRPLTGENWLKATAWLLGYASHVIADCHVHPVVNIIAKGEYGPETAEEHRRCEMHQDAFIYRRLNMGEPEINEHLDATVCRCTDPKNPGNLDPIIKKIWLHMLNEVHPHEFHINRPNPNRWHQRFCWIMDNLVDERFRLIPLARHVAQKFALTYPKQNKIDHAKYIENLYTPRDVMNYDQIFDKTLDEIASAWSMIITSLSQENPAPFKDIDNTSMDSGKNSADSYTLWEKWT